jgi:hypothetical protein
VTALGRIAPDAAAAVITLLTGFIAWIVSRTVILALRGQFFPRPD